MFRQKPTVDDLIRRAREDEQAAMLAAQKLREREARENSAMLLRVADLYRRH